LTNHYSGGVRTSFLPAPRLGEHTVSVMTEYGFSKEEIDLALSQDVLYTDLKVPTP